MASALPNLTRIGANAQETRDAGCLGPSPVIPTKIHSLDVRCSTKSRFKAVQGHRYLYPPESLQAVLVMISSKWVSICNRSRARLVDKLSS